MKSYTIAIREKNKRGREWRYVGADLEIYDTPAHCKPLTRAEAVEAARRMTAAAGEAGRPVKCDIVELTDGNTDPITRALASMQRKQGE